MDQGDGYYNTHVKCHIGFCTQLIQTFVSCDFLIPLIHFRSTVCDILYIKSPEFEKDVTHLFLILVLTLAPCALVSPIL